MRMDFLIKSIGEIIGIISIISIWESIGKDWSYITTNQGKLEATGR